MVTSGLWTDFNNDGWKDLIIVGEWMPITIFQNNQGEFSGKIEIKNCKVTIWDLGGQASFRKIWEHYYEQTNGVIFMIDSSDEERFIEGFKLA